MTTIVTLKLDAGSQAWFEELRRRHYPPALNRIPAHLSLFHALPGDASVRHVLREASASVDPFAMSVEGVGSMGRGVLYALASAELMTLHSRLAGQFRTYLTPQDKQPLRPHVVVQNKVEPWEAKALLAQLQAEFVAREVQAVGLDWWEYLGGPWRLVESFAFGAAKNVGHSAIAAKVVRLRELSADGLGLLQEYYDAVGVVLRDGPEAMRELLENPRSGMWVAYSGTEAAGCVVFKAAVPKADAGECKRLYVRPRFRGAGLADALMEALERFACASGVGWVYLDTNDAFTASITLYERRGYEACDRYNDNPQATRFFRKRLTGEQAGCDNSSIARA